MAGVTLRRQVVVIALIALAVASCSGSAPKAAVPSTTTPRTTTPVASSTEFRLLFQNTDASITAAIAGAEPGSAAAQYFQHHLFDLRAYLGVGGHGGVMGRIPLAGGGIAYCGGGSGARTCWNYQHPRFARDGRLSSFDINDVDAGKLVRGTAAAGLPAATFTVSPTVSLHVVSLLLDPESTFVVMLQVENTSDQSSAVPTAGAFDYIPDGSKAAPSVAHADPPTLAPHSSALVDLQFSPANFGGVLTLTIGGQSQTIRIAGPAVALGNPATDQD